tara:strand:- start:492 stop:1307 length:816 start_codon:yes stop_codon:yes gene_type:complete
VEITFLARQQLDQATALSQAENWPHRLEDWQMLMTLSQGRAVLRGGAMIATALRTDYGPDVSLLNMIIVRQSERSQGIGYKLMSSLMDEVRGRELRLVATGAGIRLYKKVGFQSEGKIFQCQGEIASVGLPDDQISPATPGDTHAIIELDSRFLAADRSALVQWLVKHARLAVVRGAEGELCGYAAVRRFGKGHVIGPIQANSERQAQNLIRYFAVSLAGQFVRIDTDEGLGLMPWLEDFGLKCVDTVTRMRKNSQTNPRPVFGLCSQALG